MPAHESGAKSKKKATVSQAKKRDAAKPSKPRTKPSGKPNKKTETSACPRQPVAVSGKTIQQKNVQTATFELVGGAELVLRVGQNTPPVFFPAGVIKRVVLKQKAQSPVSCHIGGEPVSVLLSP